MYYYMMENTSEIHSQPIEQSISEAVKTAFIPASRTVVVTDLSSGSVAAGLEPAEKPLHTRCPWCGRAFTPRATGGSGQKFCFAGHRQQFWIAARHWTMRAIETGRLQRAGLVYPLYAAADWCSVKSPKISIEQHIKATHGIVCRKDEDVLEESPGAYKPIDAVMAAQTDLVEVVYTLKQILNVKG